MNLSQSKLPNLECLRLLSVQVKEIPVLSFPKLAEIEIKADEVADVEKISLWDLPCLSSLNISYLQASTPIASFNNLHAKEIEITGGCFKPDFTIQTPIVEVLNLTEVNC